MKKKHILIVGIIFMTLILTGCKKNIEPTKGGAILFKTEKGNVSINDFYNDLKMKHGLNTVIDLADKKILNSIYKGQFKQEEIDYIKMQKGQLEAFYEQYKTRFATFEAFIEAQYGFKNNQELEDFLSLSFKRYKETEKYAKSIVTDKEIKKYYDDEVIGDMKASHILITAKYKNDDSEDVKKKAKEKAYQKALEVIKKLNSGSKFEDLVKEYSEDSKSNGGDVGWFNKGKMDIAFENATYKLKVNEYSKTPVESQFGYHIILKTGEKEKEPINNLKKDITEKISKQKLATTENINAKALIATRKKYGFDIQDKELSKLYDTFVNNINAK